MTETGLEQKAVEIVARKSEEVENQFLLGEESQVGLVTQDNSRKEQPSNVKKKEEKQQNIFILQKIDERMSLRGSRRIQVSSKDDQNVVKNRAKNKNSERQTYNSAQQPKISQQTLSQLSTPQINVPGQSYQMGQMNEKPEDNLKRVIDPALLEQKIKEIAKNIRNKVKKDNTTDKHNEASSIKKVIQLKSRQPKLSPLRQSPLLLDKNINLTLSPREFSENKLLTFEQSLTVQINPIKQVKSILRKQILQKVQKEIQTRQKIKAKKLKLDPIKHHYPMTSFRRSIIEEIKSNTLRQNQKQKEREAKLHKRRDIYNSSRYQRYAKIGSIFKRDFEVQISKENQHQPLSESKMNPEVEQPSTNIQKQASPITQIESLIQFVNNSEVKEKQHKQVKESEYDWQQE